MALKAAITGHEGHDGGPGHPHESGGDEHVRRDHDGDHGQDAAEKRDDRLLLGLFPVGRAHDAESAAAAAAAEAPRGPGGPTRRAGGSGGRPGAGVRCRRPGGVGHGVRTR